MKETYYFQHDYNARNDPKLQDVLIDFGVEGIGIFWCIIEQLYEQEGTLPLKSCKSIAFALHVECKVVEDIVKNYDLFKFDNEKFWSASVLNRLNRRKETSDKRKLAALSRWRQRIENQQNTNTDKENLQSNINADVMQDDEDCNANALHKEKKRKEKDNIYSTKVESENKFSQRSEKVDFDRIISMYHEKCTSYPRILKLSDARKQKVSIRLIDEMNGDYDTLSKIFEKMEESKFLRGDNHRGWKATFDWLFANDKNWVKVLEGNYDSVKCSTNNDCNEEWK